MAGAPWEDKEKEECPECGDEYINLGAHMTAHREETNKGRPPKEKEQSQYKWLKEAWEDPEKIKEIMKKHQKMQAQIENGEQPDVELSLRERMVAKAYSGDTRLMKDIMNKVVPGYEEAETNDDSQGELHVYLPPSDEQDNDKRQVINGEALDRDRRVEAPSGSAD